MKFKIIIFATINLLLVSPMFAKEKVKKHRDQIRLGGYGQVRVQETAVVDETTGQVKYIRKDIFCDTQGDMKCRDQNIVSGGTELDFDNPSEYTASEKIQAQNIINLGDLDIDSGVQSGSKTSTVQFFNVVTGTSYYRTFTYVWVTNALNEVTSSLEISEKF